MSSALNLEDGAHRVSSQSHGLCYIFQRPSRPSVSRGTWVVGQVTGPEHLKSIAHSCISAVVRWVLRSGTVSVGRTLWKPSSGGVDCNPAKGKGARRPRMCADCSQDEGPAPCIIEGGQCHPSVVKQLVVCWGDGAVSAAQLRCLRLEGWSPRSGSGRGQLSLVSGREPVRLGPHIAFLTVITAATVTSPLCHGWRFTTRMKPNS